MKQAAKNENRLGEQEALAVFLQRIGIENPAYDEILARDQLVDVVAWYWFTLGKAWVENARGWIIACLNKGDAPQPGYREFARLWLTMSKENYDDYLAAKYQPIDLEYYWREWELSPAETEVLDRVTHNGGLELFEEYERPIVNEKE